MRAVLIEVLLAVVVAFCLAFLVIAGSVGFDYLALAGIGLLLLSSLFAAISALGPKYQPTPFLTPMMAGTLAAVIATTLVYAGTARLPDDENPLLSAPAPAGTAQASLEPIEMEPAEAETTGTEAMEAETMEDVPMDAPPVRVVEPPAEEDDALADIIEAPVEPAEPPPLIGQPQPQQTEPEVRLGDPSLEVLPEEDVPTPPLPPPAPAPGSDAGPIRLVEGPSAASAPPDPNAPLALNPAVGGAGTAPTAAVIPPLPRIRPCGEGGPPCR